MIKDYRPIGGCPYPTISSSGELRSGTVIDHPPLCVSCQSRPCKNANAEPAQESPQLFQIRTCHRGVDYALIPLGSESIIVNGLMVDGARTDRSRRIKRDLAANRVHLDSLRLWQEAQEAAIRERDLEVDERIRQALEMFHDVQTAASSIIRSGERLQASQAGRTDDERFEALPPAAKTLVKAAGLLELRLRTMPIVTNPAAAAYGNKIPKQIYRIIDLLVRTLQPLAQAKNITLALRGSSHRAVAVYESFDLLPLTLIENALKYSPAGRRVEITVNDTDSGVSVSVCSFSPWIDPDERAQLFERRYRARITKETHPSGSGLGLYIAETVATAHSTHVLLGSDDEDEQVDGVRHCTNRFMFHLR